MAKQQRDPAKEALWRKTLTRFETSGLSVREFCKREDVAESAFYAWRRTISKRDGAGNSEPAFVPAVINGEAAKDESVVLKLAGELELHFPPATSAERIAELVHALKARGEQ